MAIFSYNGIPLQYIRTKSVAQEAIYDSSGMDYLYTKFTVDVDTVFNSALLPGLITESATSKMARLRHCLLQPRKQLIFLNDDGTSLLVSPPDGREVDDKNGPFPQHLNITQITGTQTYLVNYQIVTHLLECPTGTHGVFMSHRWRTTCSIAENFYTTKTRTGNIHFRSSVTNFNADQFRTMVAVPIDPGFVRTRSEYVLQEDGLALQYTYVDEERYLLPPAPAVKASGEYIESTPNGAAYWGEVRVTLEGAKTSDRAALLQQTILVAMSKLEAAGIVNDAKQNGKILVTGSIKETMWANEFEVRFKTRITPVKARKKGAALDLRRFTVAPAGSEQGVAVAPDPGMRGTAGIQMACAVLREACINGANNCGGTASLQTGQLPDGMGDNPSLSTNPLVVEPSIFTTPIIPDDYEGKFRTDDGGAPYEAYEAETEYSDDRNVIQLAVASMTGAACVFIQLSQPMTTMTTSYSGERVGDYPKLQADLEAVDPNLVRLSTDFVPAQTEPCADGVNMKHRIKGRFVYGVRDRTQLKLQSPLPPWVDGSAAEEAVIPQEAFVQGIFNPAGTSSLVTGAGL